MRIVFLVAALLTLQACSTEPKQLKSPCVGAEGSPCERHPVNRGMS